VPLKATVAVRITGWFRGVGLFEEVRVVVVDALFTVCVVVLDVLPT
jgi:hypothetical protein